MIAGIRKQTVVGEGGKVEILSSDLPTGTLVDVIILMEPAEPDTTAYLLSN
jgi:antitoxin YefM